MVYVTYVFLFLIAGLILIGFIFFIYWKYKKSIYTRERFAFVSASFGLSLLFALFPFMFGTSNWVNLVIEIINSIFDYNLSFFNPSISDRIVAILVFALYAGLVRSIFISWTGKTSVNQAKEEKDRDQASYFHDLNLVLHNNKELKIFHPKKKK